MMGEKRGFFAGDPVVLDPPERQAERDRGIRAAPSEAPSAQVPFLPSASFMGGPRIEPAVATFVRDAELRPGDQVGDFVVESKIGEGGMGTVYRARHPLIGKQAAIKVIKPVFASDPVAVDRFVREARSVNEIGHRNIIDIFLFAQLPSGLPYFVMEYLDGHTLQDEMAQLGRALTVDEARWYLAPVFSALEAAHAKQIIHRDIKPDNIFIVRGGGSEPIVKLLDFGLVKLAREVSGGSNKTQAGMPMGTPDYISPEQSVNHGVDHRADIYSLGILIYRMLAGRLPFSADSSYEMLNHQRFADPPRPSEFVDIPTDVEDVILWALKKRPEDRPQSVAELRHAFEAAAQPVAARGEGKSGVEPALGTAHTQPVEPNVLDGADDVPAPRSRFAIAAWAIGFAAIGALIVAVRFAGPEPGGGPADPAKKAEPAPAPAVAAAIETSALRIAVQPVDATLTVDDAPVAADVEIRVTAGTHVVRAARPGYVSLELPVTVAAGAIVGVPIALEAVAAPSVAPRAEASTPAPEVATPPRKPGRRSSMRDKDDTAKPTWATEK